MDADLVLLVMGFGVLLLFVFFVVWAIFKKWIFFLLAIGVVALLSWFTFKNLDFTRIPEVMREVVERFENKTDED